MLRSDPLRLKLTRLLVARRIAEAREEAGMTQQEVARALERGQWWVSDTEGGQRRIEAAELFAFAEVLRKPAGWFVRAQTSDETIWLSEQRGFLIRAARRGASK